MYLLLFVFWYHFFWGTVYNAHREIGQNHMISCTTRTIPST